MVTFVKTIQTDSLHFEIPIKSHLSVDILTEGGLTCSWATSNSDENSIWSNLVPTRFSVSHSTIYIIIMLSNVYFNEDIFLYFNLKTIIGFTWEYYLGKEGKIYVMKGYSLFLTLLKIDLY